MDANFKFKKIRTIFNGWITINIEHISFVENMPNGTSIYMMLCCGHGFLVHGKHASMIKSLVGDISHKKARKQ